jgi:hypothetical protein
MQGLRSSEQVAASVMFFSVQAFSELVLTLEPQPHIFTVTNRRTALRGFHIRRSGFQTKSINKPWARAGLASRLVT